METKKFRNHFSQVIEQMGFIPVVLFLLFFQMIPEMIQDMSNDETGIDVLALFDNIEIVKGIIAILLGVLLVLCLVIGLLVRRWYKTWIVIDNETISIERNTIRTVKNTIGLANISNVNIEQNLFEMLIGTSKLKLDTNSFSTANSTDVKIILKKEKAFAIKEFLMNRIEEINSGKKTENFSNSVSEKKDYDIQVTAKEIIMNGFYSMRFTDIFVLLITICGFVIGVASDVGKGMSLTEALGGLVALFIVAMMSAVNIGKAFLKMYDFKVKRDSDRIYIQYGLYKKVDFTIPVDKINAIVIHQTLIARICRRYTAELINVGMGDEQDQSAFFTFYCRKEKLKEYISKIVPEFSDVTTEQLKKQPKSLLVKYVVTGFLQLTVLCIVATGIIVCTEVPVWIVCLTGGVIFFCMLLIKTLHYVTCGVKMCDDMIGLKKGIFSTRYSFIQYRKFQYITLHQNILEKKLNIMKGNITILAALSQFQNSIPYMTQQDCQLLYEKFMKNLR